MRLPRRCAAKAIKFVAGAFQRLTLTSPIRQAQRGIEALRACVDALVAVLDDRLLALVTDRVNDRSEGCTRMWLLKRERRATLCYKNVS